MLSVVSATSLNPAVAEFSASDWNWYWKGSMDGATQTAGKQCGAWQNCVRKRQTTQKQQLKWKTKRAAITTAATSGGRLQTANCGCKRKVPQHWSLSAAADMATRASASASAAESAAVAGGQLARWQVNKSHLHTIEWHQLQAASYQDQPPRIKPPTRWWNW